MKSGYKILWTAHAKKELEQAFEYLNQNFTEKEIKRLAQEIEKNSRINFTKSKSISEI